MGDGWSRKLKSFVPQHIPNVMLLAGYDLLTLVPVPAKVVRENAEWNRLRLEEYSDDPSVDGYIDSQAEWRDIKFGRRGSLAASGCGIIATYNALHALARADGSKTEEDSLPGIISAYERRGAALGGRCGIAPHFIGKYFRELGYELEECYSRRDFDINALGERSDVILVTVYNDGRDIFRQLHTVCITREEQRFVLHNAGVGPVPGKRGGRRPGYATLQEALRHISRYEALPIVVMGIRRRETAAVQGRLFFHGRAFPEGRIQNLLADAEACGSDLQ